MVWIRSEKCGKHFSSGNRYKIKLPHKQTAAFFMTFSFKEKVFCIQRDFFKNRSNSKTGSYT
ncbi:hypothetical protein M769_0107975 [Bacillus haynesii]|nr:hypothetical protein M769_0107975 [Bacillus haynesii]